MRWLKILNGLLVAGVLSVGITVVAEELPESEADMAFLEFLGMPEEAADDWEEFIDLASEGMPPMVAEVEHEE